MVSCSDLNPVFSELCPCPRYFLQELQVCRNKGNPYPRREERLVFQETLVIHQIQ